MITRGKSHSSSCNLSSNGVNVNNRVSKLFTRYEMFERFGLMYVTLGCCIPRIRMTLFRISVGAVAVRARIRTFGGRMLLSSPIDNKTCRKVVPL